MIRCSHQRTLCTGSFHFVFRKLFIFPRSAFCLAGCPLWLRWIGSVFTLQAVCYPSWHSCCAGSASCFICVVRCAVVRLIRSAGCSICPGDGLDRSACICHCCPGSLACFVRSPTTRWWLFCSLHAVCTLPSVGCISSRRFRPVRVRFGRMLHRYPCSRLA